jgi:hypothetical protein
MTGPTRLTLTILFVFVTAKAQLIPTWSQRSPANSPPALWGAAMAYDTARQQTVLFGGIQLSGQGPGGTWLWDGNNWTHKAGSAGAYLHAMAYDEVHQQVVVFGGAVANPTLTWDGNDWTPHFTAHTPPFGIRLSMAYDAARRQIVLVAGDSSGTMETWVWDGTDWAMKAPVTSPPYREGASMAYDSAHQRIVLCGGEQFAYALHDTWLWDGTNWTEAKAPFGSSSVLESVATYDVAIQKMVVYGGDEGSFFGPGYKRHFSNAIWAWDGSSWSELRTLYGLPEAATAAMAYDSARQEIVVFGGFPPPQGAPITWILPTSTYAPLGLSKSSSPSTFGQPVTLTVTGDPALPTGPVAFFAGATMLGVAQLISGVATLNTIALPAGTNSIYAAYQGKATFPVPQTVQTIPSTHWTNAPGSPIPAGAGPFAVVVADFNGDHKADLAIANAAGGNVTILLGNGDGTFSPAAGSPVPTGRGPFSLVAGDFNGDGNTDLAVANSADNTVTILLGNGKGGFVPAPGGPVPTGGGPLSLAVADFNGDGVADLAVADSGDSTIAILIGRGDGTFAPQPVNPFLQTFNGAVYVAAADFTGDGIADIIYAGSRYNAEFQGNGDGTFSGATTAIGPIGAGSVSLAVADFNGDGRPDVAAADLFANNVVTVLDFIGNLDPFPNSTVPTGASPQSVVAGDFNGDGKMDLAVANSDSNNVTLLLGDGTGNFTAAPGSPLPAGAYPFCVAVGDFNGDGRADLVVVNFSGTVTILLGAQ